MQRIVNGRMETVLTVEQMRESDAYTIRSLVSAEELMRRAAQGVFDAVNWHGGIAILAGSGNNGGDGYALACILAEKGFAPRILCTGAKPSPTAALYERRAREKNIPVADFCNTVALCKFDIVVDCLLGTGFSGTVRGPARSAIQWINTSGAYVVSVDINSGLDGDTGAAELAVVSNLTVSIGYYKQGLLTDAAARYIQALTNVDIGLLLPPG